MSKRKPTFIKSYSEFVKDKVLLERKRLIAYINDVRYICKFNINNSNEIYYYKIRGVKKIR